MQHRLKPHVDVDRLGRYLQLIDRARWLFMIWVGGLRVVDFHNILESGPSVSVFDASFLAASFVHVVQNLAWFGGLLQATAGFRVGSSGRDRLVKERGGTRLDRLRIKVRAM